MVQQVLQLALDLFGTKADYPFEDDRETAVLRHKSNKKWYGILIKVAPDKLGLAKGAPIFILNVKCDPLLMGSLLAEDGIYPGYHMNKNHWISVLLDGRVALDKIAFLLNFSYDLTRPKEKH